MISKFKSAKAMLAKQLSGVAVIGMSAMQSYAENTLFDDTAIDSGIDTVQNNLLPLAIGLLVLSIGWAIGMWMSIFDSRRWYLPIVGIVVAFFLGEGFGEAAESLKEKYSS